MNHWMRVAIISIVFLAINVVSASDDWTPTHTSGFCAMRGVCGKRRDGDSLNCPDNGPAGPPDAELSSLLQVTCPSLVAQHGPLGDYCCSSYQVRDIAESTQKVAPFVVGCPACYRNFVDFWCLLTCSPDQATFSNVTAVGQAPNNNATVVTEIDYWIDESFGEKLFDSCKDVKFGAANLPAMSFIGGGASNYTEWLEFLGLVKDKRPIPIGSPFQQNFLKSDPQGQDGRPNDFSGALDGSLVSCGDNALRCSCSDCPASSGCPLPDSDDSDDDSEGECMLGAIYCFDLITIVAWGGLVAGIVAFYKHNILGRKTEEDKSSIDDDSEEQEERTVASNHLIQGILRNSFYRLGLLSGTYPWQVLLASLFISGLFCLGLVRMKIESDPQRLWVGPGSQAARDKTSYEDSFGPFYRITQIILSSESSPIITRDNIEALFDIHDLIDGLEAPYHDLTTSEWTNLTLTYVCFKPFGTSCATQSIAQYWKMNRSLFENEQIPRSGRMTPEYCFGRWFTECLSAFGAPIDPKIVLGGFPSSSSSFTSYSSDAKSFIITLPLTSQTEDIAAARAWEQAFIHLAQGPLKERADEARLSLAFSTERSIQDELARESGVDMAVVALSYFAMLIYIALALSSLPSSESGWNSFLDIFVLSRVGLGLGGVLLVALSVSGAMGIISALGTSSSLISLEVIPFLSLAIGVDNMFLLAHALQRVQKRSKGQVIPLNVRISTTLSESGPSIALAAICEASAFFLAALLTPMPAIQTFSICAGLSVLIGFVLQVTAFVSLLTLDTTRIENRGMDLLPFITLTSHTSWPGWLTRGVGSKAAPPRARHYGGTEDEVNASLLDDGDAPVIINSSDAEEALSPPPDPWLQDAVHRYMRLVHIPALQYKPIQLGVILFFTTTLLLSINAIPRLSVGLDQSIALPSDSYLQRYYQRVLLDLRVGPPLLLIVRDLDLRQSNASSLDIVKKVCSVSGCDPNSMLNQITLASRSPHRTSIATPAASWIDDFSSWISPSLPKCCRQHPDGFCPPPDQAPCSLDPASCSDCQACVSVAFEGGRPSTVQFQSYLPWFLSAIPSEQCAKGGAGVYTDSIQKGTQGSVKGLKDGIISSSSFRVYYIPLNEQRDFIAALRHSRSLVESLKESLGLDVYSYSMFHVFFEQYLSIYADGAWLALSPLPIIFTVIFLATGSLQSSFITTSVLASLLIHLLGAMLVLGIQLNAISLVNLAMSLGIGVEFAAHVSHSFSVTRTSRLGNEARVAKTLDRTGPSVLIGITFTKVVGVAVLSLARTRIFEVYFFRLYLALVALGAAHGLVLLPVLLMWIGS